jgi:hypothetical protein
MITNFQLETRASKLKVPLIGVYNKDTLPYKYQDGGYIVNLQDATDEKGKDLPGTHWTAFYCEGKSAAYFDSFGFPGPVQVKNYLRRFGNVPENTRQIQNVQSEICGYYCLYFIWFMFTHKKIKFQQRYQIFLSKFRSNPQQNQKLLEKYIRPL